MKKTAWIWSSIGLLALALVLRFGFSIRYPAYALGFVAVGIVVWHFRKNRAAIVGMLTGAALVLRFALRGYAYWGYLCLFIAALLLLHRLLPRLEPGDLALDLGGGLRRIRRLRALVGDRLPLGKQDRHFRSRQAAGWPVCRRSQRKASA